MRQLVEILGASAGQRLGWSLVHFLWQGALIAALLWVALRLLGRYGPRVRYAAACLALLAMAAAPVVTFCLVQPMQESDAAHAGSADECYVMGEVERPGVYRPGRLLADVLASAGWKADTPNPRDAFLIRRTADEKEYFVPLDLGKIQTERQGKIRLRHRDVVMVGHKAPEYDVIQNQAWNMRRATLVPPELEAEADNGGIFDRAAAWLSPALPWAVAAWLAGVLACSVWHVGGWARLHRLRRSALPLAPAGPEDVWLDAAEAFARRLRLRGPVRLLKIVGRAAQDLAGPVVVGLLRPAVLIPAAVLTGLPPQHVEAVLAHELAHIRRHDYFVNLLQTLVETLLFYHPAVWWASARIRDQREHCCDDLAIAAIGRSTGVSPVRKQQKDHGRDGRGTHGRDAHATTHATASAPACHEGSRMAYASALAALAELITANRPPRAARGGILARLAPAARPGRRNRAADRIAPGATMSLLARIRRLLGIQPGPDPRWPAALASVLILAAVLAATVFYGYAAPLSPANPLLSTDANGQAATQPRVSTSSGPATQPAATPVDELVRQLGAESYKERQTAQESLIALGRPAVAALRKALADADPERAIRAKGVLAAIRLSSVNADTTFLTRGQSLDEATKLLSLAKAKDITPQNARNDNEWRELVYELPSRMKVHLSARQDNGAWTVGTIRVECPPNFPQASQDRRAVNVTGAKFDIDSLGDAFAKADDAFVGRLVSANLKETFWSSFLMSWSEATYEVVRPLKGDLAGKVTVHYLIIGDGEHGEDLWLTPGKPKLREDVFRPGAEHLVCVALGRKQPGGVASETDGKRAVIYMTPHPADAEAALKADGFLPKPPPAPNAAAALDKYPRRGVGVRVEPDKAEYFLGENVLLHWTVGNNGAEPFTITMGGDSRNSVGRSLRFKIEAVDEQGKPAEDPYPNPDDHGGRGGERIIAPGEQFVDDLQLLRYREPAHGGTWTIRVYHDLGWEASDRGRYDPNADHSVIPPGQRNVPIATTRIRLVVPDANQARQVVADMLKLPKNPDRTWGKPGKPFADFEMLRYPVYLPIMKELAEKGDARGVTAIGAMAFPDATAALLDLMENKDPAVSAPAREMLVQRIIPGIFGWGNHPTRLRYLADHAWRDDLEARAAKIGWDLLAQTGKDARISGARVIMALGGKGDLPRLVGVMDRLLPAYRRDNVEQRAWLRPASVCDSLASAAERIIKQGARPEDSTDTPGKAVAFLAALKLDKDFRPRNWQAKADALLRHELPFIRAQALQALPLPLSDAAAADVARLISEDCPAAQGRACDLAGRAKLARFREPLMDLLARTDHEWLIRGAFLAAGECGEDNDRRLEVCVGRLGARTNNMNFILLGLMVDAAIQTQGGYGNNSIDDWTSILPGIQKAWLDFIAANRQALRAGRKFPLARPPLTRKLFPPGMQFQRPDKPDWPDWTRLDDDAEDDAPAATQPAAAPEETGRKVRELIAELGNANATTQPAGWHKSPAGLESRITAALFAKDQAVRFVVSVRNPTDKAIEIGGFGYDAAVTLDGTTYAFVPRPMLSRNVKWPVVEAGVEREFDTWYYPVAETFGGLELETRTRDGKYLKADLKPGRHTVSYSLGPIQTDTIEFDLPAPTDAVSRLAALLRKSLPEGGDVTMNKPHRSSLDMWNWQPWANWPCVEISFRSARKAALVESGKEKTSRVLTLWILNKGYVGTEKQSVPATSPAHWPRELTRWRGQIVMAEGLDNEYWPQAKAAILEALKATDETVETQPATAPAGAGAADQLISPTPASAALLSVSPKWMIWQTHELITETADHRARSFTIRFYRQRRGDERASLAWTTRDTNVRWKAAALDDGTLLLHARNTLTWVLPDGTTRGELLQTGGKGVSILAMHRDGLVMHTWDDPVVGWFVPIRKGRLVEADKVALTGDKGFQFAKAPAHYKVARHGNELARADDLGLHVVNVVTGAHRRFPFVGGRVQAFDGRTALAGRIAMDTERGRLSQVDSGLGTFLAVRNGIGYAVRAAERAVGAGHGDVELVAVDVASNRHRVLARWANASIVYIADAGPMAQAFADHVHYDYAPQLYFADGDALTLWDGSGWRSINWLVTLDEATTQPTTQPAAATPPAATQPAMSPEETRRKLRELIAELGNASPVERSRAATALGRIGEPAVPAADHAAGRESCQRDEANRRAARAAQERPAQRPRRGRQGPGRTGRPGRRGGAAEHLQGLRHSPKPWAETNAPARRERHRSDARPGV